MGATITIPKFVDAQITLPRESQRSEVRQTIGVTAIEVIHHRPAVKERPIWGELVPYGKIWRAGANENTTISFSNDVKIEGQDLPAGTYGFHTLPNENEWTLIFNKVNNKWGSFSYKETEDALRVNVKPILAPHQEFLVYGFDQITKNTARAYLHWEKLLIPFTVEVNVDNAIRSMVDTSSDWQASAQYANYLLRRNNYDSALEWANKSAGMKEDFMNLSVKMMVLTKKGEDKQAGELTAKLLTMGDENQINGLGYSLMNIEETDHAIEIFETNVAAHQDSWNVYDSLGEAMEKAGNRKQAIANYSKALELVKNERQKERITNTLKELQGEQ